MSHRGKEIEKRPLTDSDYDTGPAPKGAKKAETSRPDSKGAMGEKEPSWDLGNNKWVKVGEFKGQTYIDIREYYVDKETKEAKPGKKGISLDCQQYQKLKVKRKKKGPKYIAFSFSVDY